ncbi:MAG: septal ring lytic transglycosylase RlpA family protein [Desulfomonilaceae bacterium]
MKLFQLTIIALFITILTGGCASRIVALKQGCPKSYVVRGRTYYPLPKACPGFFQNGVASWYGPGFDGKKTSSGEVYDMHGLTAAHSVLPLNTLVRVTNLKNNKDVVVRINDRGPFVKDRVIDLSLAAAQKIGMVAPGTTPVRVTVIGPGNSMLASAIPARSERILRRSISNPFFSRGRHRLLALRDP